MQKRELLARLEGGRESERGTVRFSKSDQFPGFCKGNTRSVN